MSNCIVSTTIGHYHFPIVESYFSCSPHVQYGQVQHNGSINYLPTDVVVECPLLVGDGCDRFPWGHGSPKREEEATQQLELLPTTLDYEKRTVQVMECELSAPLAGTQIGGYHNELLVTCLTMVHLFSSFSISKFLISLQLANDTLAYKTLPCEKLRACGSRRGIIGFL